MTPLRDFAPVLALEPASVSTSPISKDPDRESVATHSFRLIERGISSAHQGDRVHLDVLIRIERRNPDRNGDWRDEASSWVVRHQRSHALGKRRGCHCPGIRREKREFVTTPSRAKIGQAKLALDCYGDVTQSTVAGVMAHPVVDDLETVQVD